MSDTETSVDEVLDDEDFDDVLNADEFDFEGTYFENDPLPLAPMVHFNKWGSDILNTTHRYGGDADLHGYVAFEKARVLARQQADTFRKLADLLERTGIPVDPIILRPAIVTHPYRYREHDLSMPARREYARIGAQYVDAMLREVAPGAERKKISTEYDWGLQGVLPGGVTLKYTTTNAATCSYEPVFDEDGKAVMETETKYESVAIEVTTQKMQKKCITLFGD